MNIGFIQPTVKGKLNDSVEVRKSNIHGLGLFATRDIEEETRLHETHAKTEAHGWVNISPNNLSNHSKVNENCEIRTEKDVKVLYSTSPISIGDELLIDYTKDEESGFEKPQEGWKR